MPAAAQSGRDRLYNTPRIAPPNSEPGRAVTADTALGRAERINAEICGEFLTSAALASSADATPWRAQQICAPASSAPLADLTRAYSASGVAGVMDQLRCPRLLERMFRCRLGDTANVDRPRMAAGPPAVFSLRIYSRWRSNSQRNGAAKVAGDTDDQDQSGAGVSPREPIGGLPGRRQGPFDAPLYPLQPEQAWLQGTVLIVEFNRESADCDLVAAVRIRIRRRPLPVFNRGWAFEVLYAYQDDKSTPARLVLAGPGWFLLTGKQFRRLAEIIGARHDAGDRSVREIVRRLNRMADEQDIRSHPLDWSFRSDPQGLRRQKESQ